ncbi:MAG: Crp/Fnr family transcriptional regulator [Sphingobacteriales bacterium]|nr:MAG: Crp/Fnr family transcriptional regulator [Sphingobacteriales bacterium]
MQAIQQYLSQLSGNYEDWDVFAEKMEQIDIAKNGLLLKAGQVENYLYFIEYGLLRFYFEKEEKEITFDFAFEGNFTSAYTSFLTRQPNTYNIQALVKTSIWRISYNHLQEIYNTTPNGQMVGRIAAEQLFIRKNKREASLLTETAEERYLNLLKEQPQLIQEIPLKYLSSYIGITPQALSRIRKRIS